MSASPEPEGPRHPPKAVSIKCPGWVSWNGKSLTRLAFDEGGR